MLCPQAYYEIFQERATLVKVTEAVEIRDWMNEARKNMIPTSQYHFHLMPSKRILFKKNNQFGVVIKAEENYTDQKCALKSLFKKGKQCSNFSPANVEYNIKLDNEKIRDLKQLMTLHLGTNWTENVKGDYFKELISRKLN